jgi:acyl-CoA thioesterase I
MFLYTALGDSITYGSGATSPRLAYTQQVVAELKKRDAAERNYVLAAPAWTSRDLLAAVHDLPLVPLQRANAVTIWVGGNDIGFAGVGALQGGFPAERLAKQALAGYARNLALLAGTVRQAGAARLVLCSQYNPFPHSPIAVEAVGALNAVTVTVAREAGAVYAPVDSWFEGRQSELIAGYRHGRVEDALQAPQPPIHPNDRGHALIARRLTPLLG